MLDGVGCDGVKMVNSVTVRCECCWEVMVVVVGGYNEVERLMELWSYWS